MTMHLSQVAQLAAFYWDKAPNKVLPIYSDYVDVSSFDLMMKLPKNISITEYAIKLIEKKQLPYGSIYVLCLVDLETLSAYIETHPKTEFIRPFKSSISTPILFDKKSNGSFCLYDNYQSLNNLTIKYQYSLPLIDETLDLLGWAKWFT